MGAFDVKMVVYSPTRQIFKSMPFEVGAIVTVDARLEPGSNKPGGAARVTGKSGGWYSLALDTDGSEIKAQKRHIAPFEAGGAPGDAPSRSTERDSAAARPTPRAAVAARSTVRLRPQGRGPAHHHSVPTGCFANIHTQNHVDT